MEPEVRLLPRDRTLKGGTFLRYAWFAPWLGASGEPLSSLVADITQQVEAHEVASGTRQRARKKADLLSFHTAVEVTVANLAKAVLVPPENGRLAVDASHGREGMTRYDQKALGKQFRPLLQALEDLGHLDYKFSVTRGEKSSIAPTATFAAMVKDRGIAVRDFGQVAGEEVIWLTRKVALSPTVVIRDWVTYRDTEETIALRADMLAINEHIAKAHIAYVGNDDHPDLGMRTLSRRYVLLKDQTAPRFDQSGRLFGGFWQHLERSRRAHLRLNGEAVVELDYGSMFTRLAYARTGQQPPAGDLYRIPGLEEHRDAVKLAMNVFLFDTRRRNEWPPEMEGLLTNDWTVARTKAAILKDVWSKAIGYQLMWQESEVLVAVLKTLVAENITALPIHDAVIAPASAVDRVRTVMEETALRLTGVRIPVAEK